MGSEDETVERLEFSGERELLRRALRKSGQAIGLCVRRATIDNFGYVTILQITHCVLPFSAVHAILPGRRSQWDAACCITVVMADKIVFASKIATAGSL